MSWKNYNKSAFNFTLLHISVMLTLRRFIGKTRLRPAERFKSGYFWQFFYPSFPYYFEIFKSQFVNVLSDFDFQFQFSQVEHCQVLILI